MTDQPNTRRHILFSRSIVVLLYAAAIYAVARPFLPRPVTPVATLSAAPVKPTWSDGSWFWIERAEGSPDRLVRVVGDTRKELASAAEIVDFAVAGKSVVWIGGDNGKWGIHSREVDSASIREIVPLTRRPTCVGIVGDRVIWMQTSPPLSPDAEPFPTLGSRTHVHAMPLAAEPGDRKSMTTVTLMEPDGLQVIGGRGDDVYVSTFRSGALGSTVFHRVSLKSGAATRLAGAAAKQDAILTSEGVLYWVAPSREAALPQTACSVRRVSREGAVETVSDWLPVNGRLFETRRGLIYVDGSFSPRLWRISDRRDLPRPLPTKDGYGAVAAGGGEVLVHPIAETDPKRFALLRMGLP